MVFNKLPVLDKGFVAFVASGMDDKTLAKLFQHYNKGNINPEFIRMATVTLVFKCPLFVNMFLYRFGLNIVGVEPADSNKEIEFFTPDEGQIRTTEGMDATEIRKHMEYMTGVLKVTQAGYVKDGCDHFVSQVNLPISVYNEVVVSGTLDQWIRFFRSKNLPSPIESYRQTSYNIVKADFRNLDQLMNKVI